MAVDVICEMNVKNKEENGADHEEERRDRKGKETLEVMIENEDKNKRR